jgi:ankyrin repeat protein
MPLHLAAADGHIEVVQYLVQKGAALEAVNQVTQSHTYLRMHAHTYLYIFTQLMQYQPPHYTTNIYVSLLLFWSINNNFEIYKYLLTFKIDLLL